MTSHLDWAVKLWWAMCLQKWVVREMMEEMHWNFALRKEIKCASRLLINKQTIKYRDIIETDIM